MLDFCQKEWAFRGEDETPLCKAIHGPEKIIFELCLAIKEDLVAGREEKEGAFMKSF